MQIKKLIKRSLVLLFRFIPYLLGRKLFGLWLTSIANKDPKAAMRSLLNLDDDLAGYLDHVAMRYDNNGTHVKHRLMEYHNFFVERVRPGERVLDIGCGYGAVAWSMATRANAMVTGIDLDAENILKARKLFPHPNLAFIRGDVLKDLPQGQYDTIVLSNTLEHIENRIQFLKTTQERVKPNRWLIRVPMFNRHWHVPMRKELGMFYFNDRTHYIEYTRESFSEELRAAGLTLTHVEINWGEIWAEARSNA